MKRRMKQARTTLCGLLAAASLTLPAHGVRTVPVQVDGQLLPGTSHLEEGVTYVPLRYLLDSLGGWEVEWDSTTSTAEASSSQRQLS